MKAKQTTFQLKNKHGGSCKEQRFPQLKLTGLCLAAIALDIILSPVLIRDFSTIQNYKK